MTFLIKKQFYVLTILFDIKKVLEYCVAAFFVGIFKSWCCPKFLIFQQMLSVFIKVYLLFERTSNASKVVSNWLKAEWFLDWSPFSHRCKKASISL